LLTGLAGFNIGVEAGQMVIVLIFLPVAYGLRTSWGYQRIGLQWGSVAILLLASAWGMERLMNWRLLPF